MLFMTTEPKTPNNANIFYIYHYNIKIIEYTYPCTIATPNSNNITMHSTKGILENPPNNNNICLQNMFTQIRTTKANGRMKYETISII